MLSAQRSKPPVNLIKFLIATLVAIVFLGVHPSFVANAKAKLAKHGTIKILSHPGGLPLEIDGKSLGLTSTDFRAIDLEPGVHSIVVTMPNGQPWTRLIELPAGRLKCIELNYQPGAPPVAQSPCPFPISISAPSQVSEGEVITYRAEAGYNGNTPLKYSWELAPSNARILSGAGTPSITVDSTGLGGQRVAATLVVDDGSDNAVCRQLTRATTFVPPPPVREIPAKEFDICSSCSNDDQKARLDNLAVELQLEPSTRAYIISYGARTSRPGQANRLSARAMDYIVTKRGVDPSRIVVVNGGFREEDTVELWVVPSGAKPPQPTPTVMATEGRPLSDERIRPRKRG